MTPDEVLSAFAGGFVDELARCGVRHVVICPGSRSTPLAMMCEEHPQITIWMHLEERSAAFFALGLAKGRGEPVAVLCSSGTAAANFLPAVIEARYARVPLLVLTADRPPELREVGAPQTIDQIKLYGDQVKLFVEVALPEATDGMVVYIRALADRAVATGCEAPAGPVHLNFPFREPLVPSPGTFRPGAVPQTSFHAAPRVGEPEMIESIAADLKSIERGLIICGPQPDPVLAHPVAEFSRALGYPVLADPLSQVRCGIAAGQTISSYDALLRDAGFAASMEPEIVLRLGAIPTSKPLTLYLQQHRGRQMVVDEAGWSDPIQTATDVIHADLVSFCRQLAGAAGESLRGSHWLEAWRQADAAAQEAMESYLADLEEPFEGKVFAELSGLVPEGTIVFAGSSMPVRDLDTFFPAGSRPIRFLANRGANGIDGVVSSALGASLAGPLVLVIGDLSFYHDMNGLLAAKLYDLDATIILLNNNGGGIFSFLPQVDVPAFETLFGTPHGLDFQPTVEMYGGSFDRVTTWPDFQRGVAGGLETRGLSVVEMPTNRERNVVLHREVWQRVSSALRQVRGAAV